ncbi:hypothetical protein BDF14DRAFT_501749 [Spinellus fusiger]|nr:hypothetical protein BDF14DRAFT_501749 [Spinellus fusiger]
MDRQVQLFFITITYAQDNRTKACLDVFAVFWFVIGNYLVFTSTTCAETAMPLYYLTLTIIVYGYIILTVPVFLCTAVIFCLPCVLVGMRLLHVRDGVDMGGSSAEEMAAIPVYRFQSKPIGHPTMPVPPDPSRPLEVQIEKAPPRWLDVLWLHLGLVEHQSQEEPVYGIIELPPEDQLCAICLSLYEDSDILCKLGCHHHFHKACVHEWLALNALCPMCKQDTRSKP